MRIDFNKPYFTGKETDYIRQAVESEKISGDGLFTKKCHAFFESNYNFLKVLLTTSCTDALEMAASPSLIFKSNAAISSASVQEVVSRAFKK